MIGELPAVVYVALLTAIVLLLVLHRGPVRRVTRGITRSVWCPVLDRHLTATLREDCWDGSRVDVEECAAFSPAAAVTCGKACLRLTRRPREARASGIPLLF